jgi:hypothetical protein
MAGQGEGEDGSKESAVIWVSVYFTGVLGGWAVLIEPVE